VGGHQETSQSFSEEIPERRGKSDGSRGPIPEPSTAFCASEKPAGVRGEKERENLRWGAGRSMEAIFGKQEVEGIKKGA
jgi:hypothetical protein